MVEQDAARSEDAVALAVVDRHPVRIELGDAVGAARIEGRRLRLRDGLHLAEHLRGGGLVETDLRVDDADRLQEVHRAPARDVERGQRLLERDADEALRREIVNLVGLRLLDEADRAREVRQVILDQMQVGMPDRAHFGETPEIDRARPTERAVDRVTLRKQQLRQVCPILAGDAGDDRLARHGLPFAAEKLQP